MPGVMEVDQVLNQLADDPFFIMGGDNNSKAHLRCSATPAVKVLLGRRIGNRFQTKI